jgi:hypothetical protein
MRLRHLAWAGFVLALEVCCASAASKLPFRRAEPSGKDLPLEQLTVQQRQIVKQVLERPAFAAQGPSESFYCKPEHYRWLLDHPDRAVTAWRRLGAKCVSITCKGEQQFGWNDNQGSEVTWEAVHRGPELRIWYAEGKVRPGAMLPLVPVKALLVMRHKDLRNAEGATLVQHQAELFLQTDSKTVALLTRMLGPGAHRVAEQGLGQLQLFFSGLSWYLDRHPEHEEILLGARD